MTLINLTLLALFLDQISKHWIRHTLTPYVLSPWLQWVCLYNEGMLWGLGQGYGVYATVMGSVGLCVMLWRTPLRYTAPYTTAFLVAGCLGNALDRCLYGAVLDWIDLHWHGYHWPAFNLADVYLSWASIRLLCLKNTSFIQRTS